MAAEPFVFDTLRAIATLQYYCLASVTLLYYDFALTINQEIQRIWKQRISIVSYMFFLNRYLTCLGYVPIVYFVFDSPDNEKLLTTVIRTMRDNEEVGYCFRCTMFVRFPGALSTITQCFVVCLLIMRVYALYQRRTWILWTTIPLGILTICVSAWGFFQIEAVNLTFGRQAIFKACIPSNLKSSIAFKTSWFIDGAFDTLIFALTVSKTLSLYKTHREAQLRSKLIELLARDGAMFYGILAVANLINVVFFLTNVNTFFEESAGNNSVLTHVLTSILLSRLILNLRDASSPSSRDSTGLSTGLIIAPPEDISLVSASTFSNSTTTTARGSDHTWSSLGRSTAADTGSIVYQSHPPPTPNDSRV